MIRKLLTRKKIEVFKVEQISGGTVYTFNLYGDHPHIINRSFTKKQFGEEWFTPALPSYIKEEAAVKKILKQENKFLQ